MPSTFTALAPFDNANPVFPYGNLVEDSNSNLFGTTQNGGANGEGTIFELAAGSGTLTVLASFDQSTGTFPQAGLIEDSSGDLFGTTSNGGANDKGTVFVLPAGGNTILVLASFDATNADGTNNTGANPLSGLIEDANGNLFGTTNLGGANNYGTVFELAAGSSTITTLASFTGPNGANPLGGLIEDSNGDLFGTTSFGGASGVGTIFELAAGSNAISTLGSFDGTNGASPLGGLVQDGNGNLFGTTNSGGTAGLGTLYELASGSNTITALASFNGPNGANPLGGPVEDPSGNFFGTTSSGGANGLGTVYELASGSHTITTLVSFNNINGASPLGGLLEDGDGDLFGTTNSGGANHRGAVFELQGPSITTQPPSSSATVGQTAPVSLAVIAGGGAGSLSYQWQISTDNGGSFADLSDGPGVTGTTSATLTLSGFTTPGSAEYRVIVTDAKNVSDISDPSILTINAVPSITGQPHNATATVGQSAAESFTIADNGGTAPLAVRWQISTDQGVTFTDLSNGPGVAGANTATLTVSGFTAVGSPEYKAIVTDANNVSVISNPATLIINAVPSITTQPQNAVATAGQSAAESFTIADAGGTTPLSVHWQISTDNGVTFTNLIDGAGISGAGTTTLTVSGFASAGTPEYKAIVTDANNVSVVSNPATLTINAAPSITTQPQNAAATIGQSASESFTIADNGGTAPVTVHWQISTDNGVTFTKLSDGPGVAGTSTTTLTISGFTAAGAREYQAVVTDVNNVSATSNAAILSINAAPVITMQPVSQLATTGQTGSESFSVVAANGTAPLGYQWKVSTDGGNTFSNLSDSSGVSGSTTATLTISGSSLPASGTEYEVLVTDANGVAITSTTAILTINVAPSITIQPQDATVTAGQSASVSFTIADSGGTTPLGVEWQISTDQGVTFTNLSDGPGIAGSTTATLTVSGFTTAGTPEYRAVVTDANNVSATSNAAVLTINAATVIPGPFVTTPPSITMQPENTIATVGQSAAVSFTIGDSGDAAPLSVQWQISTDNGATFTNLSDNNGVSGASTTTLTISGFTSAGSREYRAIVTDTDDALAISNAAILTINAAPSVTGQPQNATATVDQSTSDSFTIADNGGTTPIAVHWQISTDNGVSFTNLSDGPGVAGSATSTLTVSGFTAAGSPEYRAIITDANNVSVISNAAILTINAAPLITTQPQDATATVGQSGSESFTIADSGGTASLTVQWQISTDNGVTFTNLSDGPGVAGSTTATLTVSGFTSAGSREYRAIITDANQVSATSNPAALLINPAAGPATNQSWLAQVYVDFFNRPVDSSGMQAWGDLLNQGVSRTQVVRYIQSSLEYRTDVVEALYGKLLHRSADPSGLGTFTAFLGNGGTAEQAEAAIIGSPEYFQLHGGSNASFLSGVYQDVLNRQPDASGAQSWGSKLAGGTSREAVASAILASLESDTDEVQSLYNEFLHRSADPSGLSGFVAALQQGVANEIAIASIVGSEEYFARTGTVEA